MLVDESSILEPFFVIYTSIIKTLTDNWNVFIFLSTLIDLLIISLVFKRYSSNYSLSLLLFFTLNIGLEFDLMRNMKAILLILLSLQYIKQRNLLKFLLIIVAAFMFHRSALMFIPLYFMGNMELKEKKLSIFLIIINIFYFIDFSFFNELMEPISESFGGAVASKYYWYSKSEIYASERGFTLGYFYKNISFILLIIYSNKIYSYFPYGKIMINAMIIYMTVSFVFNDIMVFVDRTEMLYSFSFWFVWPYILSSISEHRYKILALTIMILFCTLRIYKQTNNIMYEYENILFKSKNYQQRIESNVATGRKILDLNEK